MAKLRKMSLLLGMLIFFVAIIGVFATTRNTYPMQMIVENKQTKNQERILYSLAKK